MPETASEKHADRYSAQRYTALVESSDDAIITKNLEGIIESWNPAAERIFGYTEQEAVGRPIQILIPLGHENEEPEILGRIKKGERIDHYETIRRRKDGSLVEISLTVSPVKDDDGTVVGASKIVREITDRKRIDFLQRRLSAIVESSDDAIISKNLNGIIQSWNSGAEKIFGYTASEAVGRPVLMLIPKEYADEEPAILERIRRGERIDHYETVRRRKDGALIHVSLAVAPIKDGMGTVIAASKIARDITEKVRAHDLLVKTKAELDQVNAELEKRVEERTASLQEALAQMQEFTYTVSHDLRSPVRAMQGYAEALMEDYSDRLDERGKDYLRCIGRSSVRMDNLIRDVLAYTRLSYSETKKDLIDTEKFIDETILKYEEFRPERIEVVLRRPLLNLTGDESLLAQVMSNILSNAVKFVAAGTKPKVEIWTEPRGECVRLWVKDNGVGINPKFHSRLFGMFEKAHQDLQVEGTGIGLAIGRRATERMGGKIGVESDGTNGSAFWIELPAKL